MSNPIHQAVKTMLSDAKFYMDYSRYDDGLGRYETWNESVGRVMNMHREKYAAVMTPELAEMIQYAQEAYEDKLVLGSQRALQFGGDQIFKHEARLYNCAFSYADRPVFFQHAMYLLLAGCGVGFSVQRHHVAKLPLVKAPSDTDCAIYTIPDSIEGWAQAFGVLLSSYFVERGTFPEFAGKTVHFNASKIRPKGAHISGGFKAPGPDGLVRSLEKCRELLDSIVAESGSEAISLNPIHVYDYVMHMADAVLSGGIRRAATICIFSKDDQEMMKAKTGNWFQTNPQRGRSNNSVMLIRDKLTQDEWNKFFEDVRQFGEPGFIFSDDTEFGFNPCVEIGLRAYTEDGRSGFQFCNLTETNGAAITTFEKFLRAARASAILGTLQAGYTNFPFLGEESELITRRESLLGSSITGWMSNPQVLFDEDNMRQAARLIREVNKQVAAIIGIPQAARTTTVKPSGNASTLLGSESGIHGAHAPRYFRNVQMNKQESVAGVIAELNSKMVEESVWSPNKTDYVVSFPIITPPNATFKKDLYGVKLLEKVKKVQQIWIEEGTNPELCVDSRLRHNVSNTISVDDWDEVRDYIYENRQYFAGISLLSATGDRDYAQAPFTEVFTADDLVEMYGPAALLASGLIVDGCHAFSGDLWKACSTALGHGVTLSEEDSAHLMMRDWVRRAKKFADSYFGGDIKRATYCLKDVNNLHRWEGITRSVKIVDFTKYLVKEEYTSVDTMGAAGCNGSACEIDFSSGTSTSTPVMAAAGK